MATPPFSTVPHSQNEHMIFPTITTQTIHAPAGDSQFNTSQIYIPCGIES